MKIHLHKSFQKVYEKLSPARRKRVDEALRQFAADPGHALLRLHELQPKGCGIFSINAGGDLRCLFVEIEEGVAFIALGTHAQLYG